MKKLFLVGLLFGSLNFAQATTITISSTDLHGENAYDYLVSITPGQSIISASLAFNLTLTASGHNTFTYDLINAAFGTANTLKALSADGDTSGDYFTTSGARSALGYSSSALTALGSHSFPTVGSIWTQTYDFGTAGTLAALNTAASDGMFDFGFDPDCTYTGSITFTYTTATTNKLSVPDSATTFGLLGFSLLCLATLRRKFCIN